ncbi:MAG: TraB/GumN family protein [Sphingobium sp.]|nr:TraB/GumN family protein [Sphingobium sp.]
MVHRPRSIVRLAALLALLSAPLSAQAQVQAPAKPAASAAPEAPKSVLAKPALWVVKDKDTTIYLFGTIHLLRPGINWFQGPVKKAFDRSDTVVMEVADQNDAAMQARVVQKALDVSGPPLTQKLPEAIRPKFTQLVSDYKLPSTVVERMKPWFAAVTITSAPLAKLGYDASQGVEAQLRKYAEAAKKPMLGLETTEEQVGYFDGLSSDLQISMLVETINEQADVEKTLAQMIDAWAAGDPLKLSETMNKSMEDDKALQQILLFDRNERWADWIKARLDKPGTVFLAVGAGHLAGQRSVQDALKVRKIKTKLVKSL